MNANYATIYAEVTNGLELGVSVERLVEFEAKLFHVEMWKEEAFPPALIPLYSEPSGTTVGIWKHWACPQRQMTYVDHSSFWALGNTPMTYEIATSFEQLKYLYFMDMLAVHFSITEEVESDAKELNFNDLDLVDQLSIRHGQSYECFMILDVFSKTPPQGCYEENPQDYPGDFPDAKVLKDPTLLNYACNFEIHSWYQEDDLELRRLVSADPNSPIWFRNENQLENFNELLQSGNICGAWMSLNSIGWRLKDAREAIKRLEPFVDDPLFPLLVKAWCRIPLDEESTY